MEEGTVVDTTVAIDLIEDARAKVKAMVEVAERQTGSRMAAYEIVGQQIFKSRDWVRAFCASTPHAKPDVVIFNIHAAYRRGRGQ